MKKFLLVSILSLVGCGDPASILLPSPLPPPQKLVIVAVTGVLKGESGATEVPVGVDFKINATANRCYLDQVQVTCDSAQFAIPYWSQRQTGGAPCSPEGDVNSSSVQYVCSEVGAGHSFEVCAGDFDQKKIGCGSWTMTVF